MTDQEGGEVRRLPGGPTMSAKQIGQSKNPKATAAQSGKDAASALKAEYLNANLAPFLDIYRETAFIYSQQRTGIIVTAKDFPGLGAAGKNEDTDVEPVTINLSLEELRSVDQALYTKAIAAGLDMVMSSWALYPALDSKYPSRLSKARVQGELRGRLRFKGVTITDPIEAGALEAFGNDASRGLLAAQAGMDILLASAKNLTQGEAIVDSLISALQDGSLSSDSFAEATDRILAVRQKIPV